VILRSTPSYIYEYASLPEHHKRLKYCCAAGIFWTSNNEMDLGFHGKELKVGWEN